MNDLFAPQNDEPTLTVLSMGAGQDSTALLYNFPNNGFKL